MLAEFTVAFALLAGMLAANELGFQIGRFAARRRAERENKDEGTRLGPMQGAVLGLVGLLLGFSFAGAGSRFIDRQDLIVKEANAIGTAYLRADLLDEPQRADLRATLRRYTESRLAAMRALGGKNAQEVLAAAFQEAEQLQSRMWKTATEGVAARPGSAVLVIPAVNDVIDIHSTRVASSNRHVPSLVLALLIGCSVVALATMSYGCGLTGRRRLSVTGPVALLIGAALWTTLDMDYPRSGLIRISDAPLAALRFDDAK